MKEKEIIDWVQQGLEQGLTTFPTPGMKRWLAKRGLTIVVDLGTGAAHIKKED